MVSKKLCAQTIVAAICIALCTVFSLNAKADWLSDFYNSAGAGINVTPAQSIASQNMVGYSGGGAVWRHPTRNFYPAQLTPPSLKMGCGGIDFYLGGFSFPNKAQFVQALRNFGQASLGYFFKLALRSLAPEIAVTLEAIEDVANMINQFGMNTCKDAENFVNTVGKKLGIAERNANESYLSAVGTTVDFFDSKLSRQGKNATSYTEIYNSRYGTDRSGMSQADHDSKPIPPNTNVLWWVLRRAKIDGLTDDEIELIMSLVGPTAIYKLQDESVEDTGNMTDKPVSSIMPLEIYLGGNLQIYQCDGHPNPVDCLSPTTRTKAVIGFYERVEKAIEEIRDNVRYRNDGNDLSADSKLILRFSSVPIYRAAAMAETGGSGAAVAGAIAFDLIDYAAVDATQQFIDYYLNITLRALESAVVPSVIKADVDDMKEKIKSVRGSARALVDNVYQNRGNPFEKIKQLNEIERAMYANLNVQLAANAKFGKRQ
jgi:conjugative transfer pilus assembly protein TraH